MKTSLAILCVAAAAAAGRTSAFTVPAARTSSFLSPALRSAAASPESSSASAPSSGGRILDCGDTSVAIKRVEEDEEVMEVASYRNNLESPQMLIERQQAKRDALDKTTEALKGVGTGVALGTVIGGLTYFSGAGLTESLQRFGIVTGIFGTFLGGNNYLGKSVYVSSLDDATNRLKVDYAEGLMARQDVGFVGKVPDPELYGARYKGSNGVVACVDCQLRNCDESRNSMKYGELPPHVHIRNVDVDRGMQRRGIARALVEEVEAYAKTTPAQMITLVVDNTNFAAIDLYKSFNYDMEDISNPLSQGKYGVWTRGRSIMFKYI